MPSTSEFVSRKSLITSIKGEVNFLDSEIIENNDIINALEDDLEKLKKEYISMLFVAQKVNNSTTRLTFLFSAKSFDQLIMRLRYMEQYGQTRKLQADQIVKVQGELSGHVKEIRTRREEKNKLLSQVVTENDNLSNLKKKQSSLVRSWSEKKRSLKKISRKPKNRWPAWTNSSKI